MPPPPPLTVLTAKGPVAWETTFAPTPCADSLPFTALQTARHKLFLVKGLKQLKALAPAATARPQTNSKSMDELREFVRAECNQMPSR